MSGCCNEAGCRRSEPIHLYLADFSNQVYAVTRSRVHVERPDGRNTRRAVERHDVTDQFRAFLKANRAWVFSVLNGTEGEQS